jgi:translocation and assembly module TamA
MSSKPNQAPPITLCPAIQMLWPVLLLLLTALAGQAAIAEVDVSVKVTGVKGAQLDNVRAHLSLIQRSKEEDLSNRWVRMLYEDGPDEISRAMEPFGYYNVAVKSSLEQRDGRWFANYQVSRGDPVLIASNDLHYTGAGADRPELIAKLDAFGLKVGDRLNHQRYEEAKARLIRSAENLGYVKAKAVDAEVLVDPAANTAAIKLTIDTGPRYFYGDVSFEQDFLDPALLERTVKLQPGEPYNLDEVITFQQGLQLTGWASAVTVDPKFKQAVDGQVPIEVKLEPSKRNHYSLGVGYETDIGPRISARWNQHRINTRGHQADAFLRLSPVLSTARAAYYIPANNPVTDRFATSVEFEQEQTFDTKRRTLNGEFAFIRRTIDDKNFYKTFLEYRDERYQVGDEPSETTSLLSLGFARRFTELEFMLFPQTGRSVDYELRAASSAILSDTSYARIRVAGKILLPLGDNGRFRLAGELGAAVVEDFEKYPTSLRYFAGGDSSIRGYEYKSLGPIDDQGNVTGGKNLVVVSGEYNHRIKKHWVIASFVDAGNAFNDSLDDVNVGAGVGFRWLMDFGSVRVDFAWPITDEDVTLGDGMVLLGFGAAL